MESQGEVYDLFNKGVESSMQAQACRERGRDEEAEKLDRAAVAAFGSVLTLDPRHVGAMSGKALSLATLGETHEAVELFKTALEIEPDSAENHRQLGLCYLELGELDSGREETLRAVSQEHDPEFRRMAAVEVYNLGGWVMGNATEYRDAGRSDEERRCYEKARAMFALAGELDDRLREVKRALRVVDSCLGTDTPERRESGGILRSIKRFFGKD